MSDIGKLIYRNNDGRLAFKAGGPDAGKLAYKVISGGWTTVTFAWGSNGKDLDICAYWDGASIMQMGYGHNTSKAEQIRDAYHIFYSGDIKDVDSSEWVKIKMIPWSGGERTFRVHFNFFGYDASQYPASTCTVIAAQEEGPCLVLNNVQCGTNNPEGRSRPAEVTDPGVVLTFAADGTLASMEAF